MLGNTAFLILGLTACCLQPSLQQGGSNNCPTDASAGDDCGEPGSDLTCSPIGGSDGSKLKCVTCLCQESNQCYIDKSSDTEAKCNCPEGRTGQYCEIDIDYCQPSNSCVAPANCVDGETSYTCACPIGYSLDEGGNSCTDIDFCQPSNNCVSPAYCVDGLTGYTCKCPHGFSSDEGGYTCTDINECASEAVAAACQSPYVCQQNEPGQGWCCVPSY